MMIIKIGGGEDINLKGIIADLAGHKQPFIIVHGANAIRDELARKLGVQKRVLTSVSGYSSVYSSREILDLIMMAYAGLRNKRIIEMCQQKGINAVGLSGLDGQLIQGERNRGIRVREGKKVRIVRDYSGKPRSVNIGLLRLLIENGYTPVLCIPIIDEQQTAVNTENDDIVAVLQKELRADTIIQLIEARGFLKDAADPDSLVKKISSAELARYEEQVSGRMKRKILALQKLFEGGSVKVYLSDGRREHPIKAALQVEGTLIL